VVAGDAFVIGDRDLAPEREASLAAGGGPGAPWPAEVLAGAGGENRQRAAGRRDHGFDFLKGLGDLEVDAVQLRDRAVLRLLHPLTELFDSVDGPRRVRLEALLGLLDRSPRQDEVA